MVPAKAVVINRKLHYESQQHADKCKDEGRRQEAGRKKVGVVRVEHGRLLYELNCRPGL